MALRPWPLSPAVSAPLMNPIPSSPDAEGLRVHQFRSLEINGEFVRARHGHGATSGDTP